MKAIKECTVFDLRATQMYQDRGIPRYVGNLISQMADNNQECSFYFLLERTLPLPAFYEKFKSFGRFFFVEEGAALFQKKRICNYFISCFVVTLGTQNYFEMLFPPFLFGHAPHISGMLWDLIPLIFSKKYIDVFEKKRMFLPAYAAMCRADHLFAISEHTANDAHRLLGISKSKISIVYGGLCEEVKNAINQTHEEDSLIFHFGTVFKNKYFVYIGGDEWRKNLDRTIQAYRVFLHMSQGRQIEPLLIICHMSKESIVQWHKIIRNYGLDPKKDIFITGLVSDLDLVRLLRNAKALIFPSLYEGLGLPILESYACGTPVIASNTSSMPEIVHPDCLFDPAIPQAIGAKLYEFSNNEDLKNRSLKFGKEILEKMTWKNASALIKNHLLSSSSQQSHVKHLEKKNSGILPIFSILPPDLSGIAFYNSLVFKDSPMDVHFYHQFPQAQDCLKFKDKIPVFHPQLFPFFNQLYGYKKIVFILGNSSHHVRALNTFLYNPIVANLEKYLYLHEAQILGLWYEYFKKNLFEMKNFLKKFYSEKEKEISSSNSVDDLVQKAKIYGLRPLSHLSQIKKILVNTSEAKELLLQDLNRCENIPFEVLFLPIFPEKILETAMIEKSKFYMGHFGGVHEYKHADILLEACKIVNARYPLSLVFAGFDLKSSPLLKSKLPEFVELHDTPSHDELMALMQQVDLAVQLRWPTFGESSGVICQLLNFDKPVIATDRGSFREYKDCLILTREGITASELAEVIEQTLLDNKSLSKKISEIKEQYSIKAFFELFQKAIQ